MSRLAESWRARVLLLALGYYVAGRLALLMAIPPGYATAVWPAAGLALVGVLALGWRSFPAVVLGSFLVNFETSLEGQSNAEVLNSALLTFVIALGAGIQALVGAEAVRRFVGYPNAFDEERDVVLLLLLGGPFACCVSASCGTLALVSAGLMQVEALPFNWFTWWVGDTIGVVVFAPLMLALIGEPRDSWRRRRWAVGLPPMLGFVMVVALFLSVSRREQQRLEAEFIRRCEPMAQAMVARVEQFADVGGAVASLLRAVPEADEPTFTRFAESILARHPGLQALSWLEFVPRDRRESWEIKHGVAISQLAADGTLIPAAPADEHFVVSWIVPSLGNTVAVGFDVGSEPVRLATIHEAVRRREPTVTPPLRLVQDQQGTAGVLIVQPVWSSGGPLGEGRGFSSTVLGITRLVESAKLGLDSDGILLRLVDVALQQEIFADAELPADAPTWTTPLGVEGRTWRADFFPTKAYKEGQRSWQAWGVLAFGLILVALSEFALLVSTGREGQVASAEDRAKALLRAIPDTILRLGPDGTVRDARPAGHDDSRDNAGGEASITVPAGVAEGLAESLRALRASGTPFRTEYRETTAAGEMDFEARFVAGAGDDVLVVIRDVTSQKIAERLIRNSLVEKDVLLREIHHRVKNNLQVVSSLLNLSEDRLQDPVARALLSHTRTRVHTIALVHDQLHRTEDVAHVGFGAYLQTLATRLPGAVGDGTDRIQIEVRGDDITLPLDIAMPCGLIVNELVTNSLIHGFPNGRAGTILVSIRALSEGRAELNVRDDGDGPPPGWNPRVGGGTGLELVFTFAEQLEAEVSVTTESGVSFTFTFARKIA